MASRELDVSRLHSDPAPVVTIACNNPYKLRAMLERERGRRSLIIQDDVRMVEPGVWAVRVIQLRRFRPAWVKPAAIATGTAVAVAGVGALSWMLVSLAVSVAAGISVTALAGFGVLVLVVYLVSGRGGGGGGGQVDVRVRWRS